MYSSHFSHFFFLRLILSEFFFALFSLLFFSRRMKKKRITFPRAHANCFIINILLFRWRSMRQRQFVVFVILSHFAENIHSLGRPYRNELRSRASLLNIQYTHTKRLQCTVRVQLFAFIFSSSSLFHYHYQFMFLTLAVSTFLKALRLYVLRFLADKFIHAKHATGHDLFILDEFNIEYIQMQFSEFACVCVCSAIM